MMTDRSLKILIVGTGRLAKVLAKASNLVSSQDEIAIFGRNTAERDAIIADNQSLIREDAAFISRSDLVVMAVSPQAYRPVLMSLAAQLPPAAIVVSVTNAIAVGEIGTWTRNPVVKVIPTIAQIVRRGVTPVIAGPRATPDHTQVVMEWLRRFSLPIEIGENDSRVASNVAGSAVAAVACFARAFAAANARRAHGLDQQTLEAMMAETLAAVGDLARGGVDFEQAIESTATPGGVTEAALAPLVHAIDDLCEKMVAESFRRQTQLQTASAGVEDNA
jgi:competence protein ComER